MPSVKCAATESKLTSCLTWALTFTQRFHLQRHRFCRSDFQCSLRLEKKRKPKQQKQKNSAAAAQLPAQLFGGRSPCSTVETNERAPSNSTTWRLTVGAVMLMKKDSPRHTGFPRNDWFGVKAAYNSLYFPDVLLFLSFLPLPGSVRSLHVLGGHIYQKKCARR